MTKRFHSMQPGRAPEVDPRALRLYALDYRSVERFV